MADLTGQRLGQYLILERISKGATSTVYKAHQEKLERYVAVKVLSPHFIDEEGFLERFKQEARAVAQLDHPNILPVYDFDQVGDVVYIVMKYVDTGTLKDMMGTPMDLRVAVDVCTQIGLALGYAHRQGVVHRDVKPGNILLGEGNWALLTDFGLAKIRAGDRKLTKSGIGMGTPDYMSPEQAQGLPVDGRADLYSLGCMLHEMLIGRVPFEADSGMAVVVKHITEPPRPPREFNPQLPLAVEQVILRTLEKDSARRYQSAEAMVADLARAVGRADQLVLPDHLPTPASTARPAAARAAAKVAETKPVAVAQARLTSTRVWLREKRPALAVAMRRVGEWLAAQLRRIGRGLRRLAVLFLVWIRRTFETARAAVSAQWARRRAGQSKRSKKAAPAPMAGTFADRLRLAISPAGGGRRYLGIAGAAIAILVLLLLALRPAGDTSALSTPTEGAVASPAKTLVVPTETVSPKPTDAPSTPEATSTPLPEAPPGMAAVTGGTFKMGATGGAYDADETPPHWVTVNPFYIDVVEVTVAQYARFVGGSGYVTDAEKKGDATTWRSANSPDRQRFPVNRVSWNDADIFCRWYGKRLPTEAEWELAAKGLTANVYSWGNTFSVDRANTFERGVGQPIAIATLANASPFGAYDMIGNVWEWVADWYGGNYYATSPADNPTGPASGLERVIRGGSFKSKGDRATTTIRRKASQDGWSDDVGFRCVKDIP